MRLINARSIHTLAGAVRSLCQRIRLNPLPYLAKTRLWDKLRDTVWAIAAPKPYWDLFNNAGKKYMARWWLFSFGPTGKGDRTQWGCRLHHILLSDEDRHFHDHPWPSVSVILKGSYIEHTPKGAFTRGPGDVVVRRAGALHRLEVAPGASVWSLFFFGAAAKSWGFQTEQGWVDRRAYKAWCKGHDGVDIEGII